MISDIFIQRLKSANDIEDVVSLYVQLKRAGRNKTGKCPFHLEKTPSFSVNTDRQFFHCFGCGAGGDVITFIMKIENLDYVEAIKFLARRSGMEVPEDDHKPDSGVKRIRLLEINREAARFFHSYLTSKDGEAGRTYLKERQLTDNTIKRFGLGMAPDSWHMLTDHLVSKGYTLFELKTAYLTGEGKKGRYDIFRNRIMFPIIDLSGNVIAFGGRVLSGEGTKYINSSDTPVYNKSKTLFALNYAKNAKVLNSKGQTRILLTEGNMDAVMLSQAGFQNAIATCGTAITSDQVKLLARYAQEVIICYDSDAAGQKAAMNAYSLFSKEGIGSRVLVMEGAKDPDEFIKKFGATRFGMLLDNSQSIIDYRLRVLQQKYDISVTDEKVKYLSEVLLVLSEIHDIIEREVYLSKLADETQISKEVMKTRLDQMLKRKKRQKEKVEWGNVQTGRQTQNPDVKRELISGTSPKLVRAQEGIINFILKNPDFKDYILSKIAENDFKTDFHKRVFGIISANLQHNITPDISTFSSQLSVDEMGRLTGILAKGQDFDNTQREIDDYIEVLLNFKGTDDGNKDEMFKFMSLEEIMMKYKKEDK